MSSRHSCWLGARSRTSPPSGLLPLAILVTSIPHYGATLLRVYERAEDRRAYQVFGVWATLAIYGWLVAGVYDLALGSWLVTLYLTWSPWHYSGQSYGIALLGAAATYPATVGIAIIRLRRAGSWNDLAPALAIGHSLQYLWVTRFFACAANPAERAGSYYLKTLLAGGAIWGIPLIVFGPDLLGVRAVDAGLGLLVAAGVNVHHFVLDGAI